MFSYVKLAYEYTKLRKNFGKQTLFQSVPAQMLDSINPSKLDQAMYILQNPVHREVQAIQSISQHEINTPQKVTRQQGINHKEGGWPREVHPSNEDHTNRHRRRVMHDESYCETITNVVPAMEHYINQNNAIELYETYFTNIQPHQLIENYKVRIANSFRDPFQRPVSSVKFTSEDNAKLAVSYCLKACQAEPMLNTCNDCFLWDIHKQTEPITKFCPEHPCWEIECSPVTPELIICGLENGTINVFDIRAGDRAVSSSAVFNSHRESVTSLRFIQSRTHTEFFSGSSDGQCLWWDTRDLSKPLDQLAMSVRTLSSEQPNLNNAEGVSFLEYDYGLPTRFLCGTDSGLVINVNRMGKSYSEKLVSHWNAHNGPVRAVERSKCTFRMFLTCGDYTVRIWSEEVRTAPIIVSNPYKNIITDACWASRRYSAYMSISAGGFFYYWDLLRKYKEPVKSLRVSKHSLTKMTPHNDGELVAIGNDRGSLYLLQLSENMAVSGARDKLLMQQTYERETRREHILDNRLKEIRLKARRDEKHTNPDTLPSVIDYEELDRITEKEYFRTVQEEIRKMDNPSDQTWE